MVGDPKSVGFGPSLYSLTVKHSFEEAVIVVQFHLEAFIPHYIHDYGEIGRREFFR